MDFAVGGVFDEDWEFVAVVAAFFGCVVGGEEVVVDVGFALGVGFGDDYLEASSCAWAGLVDPCGADESAFSGVVFTFG